MNFTKITIDGRVIVRNLDIKLSSDLDGNIVAVLPVAELSSVKDKNGLYQGLYSFLRSVLLVAGNEFCDLDNDLSVKSDQVLARIKDAGFDLVGWSSGAKTPAAGELEDCESFVTNLLVELGLG